LITITLAYLDKKLTIPKCFSFVVVLIFFGSSIGFCQIRSISKDSVDDRLLFAYNHYANVIGQGSHLYSGSAYIEPHRSIVGDPFYNNEFWEKGNIKFDSKYYAAVSMRYDIYLDEVVVECDIDISTYEIIQLVKEKVSEFEMLGHRFVNLNDSSGYENLPVVGFYDILIEGETSLFARRKKTLYVKPEGKYYYQEFKPADRFYLITDKSFHVVRGKNGLYNLLDDKKKELKIYEKNSLFKYKKDPEAFITAMIEFYNKI